MNDNLKIEEFLQRYITRSSAAPELAHLIALECDAHIKKIFGKKSLITFSYIGFKINNSPPAYYATSKNKSTTDPHFHNPSITSINGLNLHYANQLLQHRSLWIHFINKYLYPEKAIIEPDSDYLLPAKIRTNKSSEKNQKISIIMTAYNAEKTIEFAANSILNQTHRNLELIIIDDNSNDRTADNIKKIASKDKRVITHKNKENAGAYISRNIALSYATGDYITCHDADDYAFPSRIERQLEEILKTKNIASICHMLRMKNNGQITRHSKISSNSPDGWKKLCHISMMYDAKFFKETLGHWDSVRAAGDSEIINRTIKATNGSIGKIEDVLLFALDTEDSTTRDENIGLFSEIGKETRKKYKEEWLKWHATSDHFYMPFPVNKRPFPAPTQLIK